MECNEEQVRLYASEIERRIGVAAHPILLSRIVERTAASLVRASSIVAVTDFHFKEGTEIARRFRRPIVRLRLRPDFLPALMGAARRGRLLMVVSSTEFFPAFKRALGLLGLQPDDLDRISVVAGSDRAGVRRALAQTDFAYVSPLCQRRAWDLVAPPDRLLTFSDHLADESIEELEAWLLLSGGDAGRDRLSPP